MAVTYGFYNALNHDRLYDAIQMSSIFDGIIRDGIFSTIGDCMVVSAPEDGLYVNVGSGRAWFNHTWTLNDTDYPIEAEEAEVVLDRIDAVILEVNSSAEVRANSIKFLKGTPSSEPVKPTLTHNAEVNQYALAYVTIRAGQTTIFQSDIENVIGTDETPFITGLLQQVSIETLLTQWESEFNTYFTNFQSTSTTEFNNWLAAKVAEYTAWYAQMQTDMDADFAEFDAWFQHMKDQLSEDAAGHLQAEIDALAEAAQKGSIVTVTTTDPTLFNRPVTISQTGFDPVTSTFDASGVAYFETVPMVGEVAITATNGTLTAHGTLTIPYFGRYTTNLEFWEAVLDISTNLQALYNRQITVSKDGATVGTTTFDGTGHATFSVHSVGTYTVSATDSASVEHTADVVVSAETTYYVDLAGIPDGRTVLPTDSIPTWLACAEESANYTTLAEVLADTELFARLCADSNACDYMARSTTWALAEGLVPVMTSATTPSGEVTCSSQDTTNSYLAWKMYDNVFANAWAPSAYTSAGAWNQYTFTEPVSIKAFWFAAGPLSGSVAQCGAKLQAMVNDTWVDMKTISAVATGTNIRETLSEELTATAIRVLCTGSNSNIYAYVFQVYTDADITTNSTAMQIVGMFDYCAEALISNETWCEALAKSEYYESVFDISVPTMTSNTTPSGVASASSVNGSNAAWKAFDRSTSDWWQSTSSTSAWLQYVFPSPVCIKCVGVYISQVVSQTFDLWLSNDESTWAKYEDIFETITTEKLYTASIDNDNSYKYARLVINCPTATYLTVRDCQFYGRSKAEAEYTPLVPTMTSNTTPSGEVIHVNEVSGYEAWHAFSYATPGFNVAIGWLAENNSGGSAIGYKFDNATRVDTIKIWLPTSSNYRTHSATFTVQASNDGTNWIDLETGTIPTGVSITVLEVNLQNTNRYTHYRLLFGSGQYVYAEGSTQYVFLGAIQLYSIAEGITIHSAANDTIYYLDGSTPVTVAVTDANGKAVIDTEDLDPGTYTLYSTVAKNPDSLSNPYTKTIKINGNTTEMYLMPILTLYWWGYNNPTNHIEGASIATGWVDYTYDAPTFNTGNILISSSTSGHACGISTRNKVLCTKAHGLITYNGGSSGLWGVSETKKVYSDTWQYIEVYNLSSNALTHVEKTPSDTTKSYNIGGYGAGASRVNYTVSAIWYE